MASNSFRKQVLKLRRKLFSQRFTLVVVVCVITISALLFEQTRFSQRAVNENIPMLGTNGGVLANSFSVQTEVTEVVEVFPGDPLYQEGWPGVESNHSLPGQLPSTLHYVWCGDKTFRFQHYLGVLSAVRILQPSKILFHSTHFPDTSGDGYHTWFLNLQEALPNLVLRKLSVSTPCTSEKLFDFVIDNFFSQDGGIFIGESVILTRSPRDLDDVSVVWSASGISSAATNGVMIVKKRIDGNILKRLVERSKRKCTSADEYNSKRSEWDCITVESNLYPRDVWATLTPFAELARWLYYGRRAPFLVPRSQTEVIPRIAHCIWLASDKKMFSQLQLTHFISVLSALYVGGFRHVYVHGDREPGGVLWEDLRTEDVTFVKTEKPETVFQTHVNRVPEHISDILRTNILFKYGGAYMDLDVIWTSRVPGWLLSYPTVVSLEWVRQGDWPETFNMGVLMAQQRAPWFKKFVPTLRDYRDSSWGRNAIMMPYRAYERQPDSLYVDRYLQVMNFDGISHPTWQSDYLRDMSDHRLTQPFNWSDVRSLHLTFPEPVPSLTSFKALREGKDVLAEIGRYVLEKSRRTHLLDSGISFR
ncbi:uncharacterized protein [Littorina saxatilis]|uniref:uncharacterized protein isoform X2 n=1 Tax=Littorina saxatilis TaxID=31220 RepID=UPI0038B45D2D